jgi:hypothetical protein
MSLQRYAAVNRILDFTALARCTIHFLSPPLPRRPGRYYNVTMPRP